jgi:hypothetical protein
MSSVTRVLFRVCCLPAFVIVSFSGCAVFESASTPSKKCSTCNYEFAKKFTPNPCDPCVPYGEIPGFGYTPTTWGDYVPACLTPYPASIETGPVSPEEIPSESPILPQAAASSAPAGVIARASFIRPQATVANGSQNGLGATNNFSGEKIVPLPPVLRAAPPAQPITSRAPSPSDASKLALRRNANDPFAAYR